MNQQEQSNQMPWDFPDVGTPEEERKKHAIPPFAEDIYILQCESVAMVEKDDKYSPTGKSIQLEWKFKILSNFNGDLPTLDNGEIARFTNTTIWSGVKQTGIDRQGKPQLTAAIMRALLSLSRNEPIPSPKAEMFKGLKLRASASIGAKQDGTPKNVWSSFASLKAPTTAPSGGVENTVPSEVAPDQASGAVNGDGSVEVNTDPNGQPA